MRTSPPTQKQIDAALAAVRRHFEPSPLETVDGALCKLESELPTASFKVRGALAALAAARASGVTRVVAASAGNHGSGVGFAAAAEGVAATIVVPRDCPGVKLEKMRKNAEVIVADVAGYDAAEVQARALAASLGVPFVSPFDDPLVMAGNGGTIGREVLAQCPEVGSVVVPIGGGGLLSGLLVALERAARPVQVVAVQSQACPSFVASLRDGRVYETWEGEPTLAEGLEGGTGATGVALARERGVIAHAVPESAIGAAMSRVWAADRRPIEGSAAVILAARDLGLLADLPEPVVLVITGGNVAQSTIERLATAAR